MKFNRGPKTGKTYHKKKKPLNSLLITLFSFSGPPLFRGMQLFEIKIEQNGASYTD